MRKGLSRFSCRVKFLPRGARARFADLGRLVGLSEADSSDLEAADAFLGGVSALLRDLDIPTPAAYGLDKAAFLAAVPKMAADALASGSPRPHLHLWLWRDWASG